MFDLETVETSFLALQFTLCTCITYRFGGGEFPPMIFFKVFLHPECKGVSFLEKTLLVDVLRSCCCEVG